MAMVPATGFEVWHWPEFHAFATRLGINMNSSMQTVSLCIDMERDEAVIIKQGYQAVENNHHPSDDDCNAVTTTTTAPGMPMPLDDVPVPEGDRFIEGMYDAHYGEIAGLEVVWFKISRPSVADVKVQQTQIATLCVCRTPVEKMVLPDGTKNPIIMVDYQADNNQQQVMAAKSCELAFRKTHGIVVE